MTLPAVIVNSLAASLSRLPAVVGEGFTGSGTQQPINKIVTVAYIQLGKSKEPDAYGGTNNVTNYRPILGLHNTLTLLGYQKHEQ